MMNDDDGAFVGRLSIVVGGQIDLHRRLLRVPIKRHAPRTFDVHLRLYPADLGKIDKSLVHCSCL